MWMSSVPFAAVGAEKGHGCWDLCSILTGELEHIGVLVGEVPANELAIAALMRGGGVRRSAGRGGGGWD